MKLGKLDSLREQARADQAAAQRSGNRFTPRSVGFVVRSTVPAIVSSLVRETSSESTARPSISASEAPRQKWMPPPNPR